jgi:hypothetical protein
MFVGRLYLRIAVHPTTPAAIWRITTASSDHLEITYDGSQYHMGFISGTTNSKTTLSLNTWYRFDFRCNLSDAGNKSVDWQIDGVDKTQNTSTGTTTSTIIRFGDSNTYTYDVVFDDFYLSATSGDYPIGPGGTERLFPIADGTHVAGTNTIEDNAGTDIGVTTAFDKLNSDPPSSTTYVRQVAVGTGNYAEVLFSNLFSKSPNILGVRGRLAYTSSATQANQGAYIISKDSFSSFTEIWGNPTTRADYSDGSTSSLFYKSVQVANVTTLELVNNLKARIGYSNDITPNPYWIDLWIEVAYGSTPSNCLCTNQSVKRAGYF